MVIRIIFLYISREFFLPLPHTPQQDGKLLAEAWIYFLFNSLVSKDSFFATQFFRLLPSIGKKKRIHIVLDILSGFEHLSDFHVETYRFKFKMNSAARSD